jgi:phosphoribosylpyrophosphate synthetase
MSERRVLFSTESYDYLKKELLAHKDRFEDGRLEIRRFPDGERYMRIETDVEGKEVILVGGTISDADSLEIYDVGCALAKYGATKLTFIIPYYGYSTMEERRVRECFPVFRKQLTATTLCSWTCILKGCRITLKAVASPSISTRSQS